MLERLVLTVTQVNIYIKSLLEKDKIVSNVAVKGEISNFKLHSSGHMYMSLKDGTGVIRAVMFRSSVAKLKFKPENGMKVVAVGRVSVYERSGDYQLYIDNMKLDGVGDLYVAFEQLKEKLSKEGLFDSHHKKMLPRFPSKIGVATAPTGAAIRDILNILGRRFPYAGVLLYPCLVQGTGAAKDVVRAIQYFNKRKSVDVLIIGRGGGSIEDLWAFNEEIVARAVFDSTIPIVSAVGHEIDFTISDFVADVRAPTPSAAAELVVPSQLELKSQLTNFDGRMLYSMKKILERNRLKISSVVERSAFKNPMTKIEEKRLYLDSLVKLLSSFASKLLGLKKQNLNVTASKLNALSPLKVLSRGYSLAKDKKNSIISSVKQLNGGDDINLTFSDGNAVCGVKKIESHATYA
jgi:exodeoxyribonuclease VII large subunit